MATKPSASAAASPSLGIRFDLPPETAMAAFRAKGVRATFAWDDMLREEHAKAFTVAKMMDLALLGDIRAALDDALAQGTTLRDFEKQLKPALAAKGWWGEREVLDAATGRVGMTTFNPARLELIFRTNLSTAYAAGHWEEILAQQDLAPYLMYDAIDDDRTRPLHHAWDNTVLRVDDPWWASHAPPSGYNCRCSVIQLDEADLAALGKTGPDTAPDDGTRAWRNPQTGEVEHIPKGIDPGWDYNPGVSQLVQLGRAAEQTVQRLPVDMQAAARAALQPAVQLGLPLGAGDAGATTPLPRPGAHPARAVPANAYITGTADDLTSRLPAKPLTRISQSLGAAQGVNDSFVVDYRDKAGRLTRAAVKPDTGVSSIIQRRIKGSAGAREAVAYDLSHALGLDVVPPTWTDDLHFAGVPGRATASLQVWIDGGTARWRPTGGFASPEGERRALNISLLDKLMANPDRHGNNWVAVDARHELWAIDNGFTLFPTRAWPSDHWAFQSYILDALRDGDGFVAWLASLADLDIAAVRSQLARPGISAAAQAEAVQRADAIRRTAASLAEIPPGGTQSALEDVRDQIQAGTLTVRAALQAFWRTAEQEYRR